MPVVHPLTKETAADDVKPLFEQLTKAFGRMPNIFAIMAHRPAVVKNLVALYGSIMNDGEVELRCKELAYLKTSILNGCEY